jgi:membrane-bound ClpP family serine protease
MNPKVTIEVEARHEGLVRQALALAEEMEHLALTAPDGAVFAACEMAVVEQGRRFQQRVLSDAVARRVEVAEKKGRRSAAALAAAARKTAGPRSVG